MKIFPAAAMLGVLFLGTLQAFPLPARAAAGDDHDTLDKGPKVGAAIPRPLMAVDQTGKTRDFASLTGKRGLILLFSRSLGW